jgi:hypothetical protein
VGLQMQSHVPLSPVSSSSDVVHTAHSAIWQVAQERFSARDPQTWQRFETLGTESKMVTREALNDSSSLAGTPQARIASGVQYAGMVGFQVKVHRGQLWQAYSLWSWRETGA